MTTKEAVAYTFAQWPSTCAECGKPFNRGTGIGRPVDISESFGGAGTKSRWACAECAHRWQLNRQSERSTAAVRGYANRKGKTYKAVPGKPSRVAAKYSRSLASPTVRPDEQQLEPRVIGDLQAADAVFGHGVLMDVLPRLCQREGLDYRQIAAKTIDTRVLAQLADPIQSGAKSLSDFYSLDRLSSSVRHQPSMPIPVDTAIVLNGGMAPHIEGLTMAKLARHLPSNDYAVREHRVLSIATEVTMTGFKVDVERLDKVTAPSTERTFPQSVRRYLNDGRVHPHLHAETATGRVQTTRPNLAGAGKRGDLLQERQLFLPEEGHVILVADLRQIDARVVAALSQDPSYLSLFTAGRDVYAEFAQEYLGSPQRRDEMKAIVNAVNYGAGSAKLAELGMDSSLARTLLTGMARDFPLWAAWRQQVTDQARRGQLLSSGYGRQIRVAPGSAGTAGPGSVAQSTARDVFMDAVLRMDDAGLTPYLRLLLHDEVVMSVPKDRYDEIAALTIKCMSCVWAPHRHAANVAIEASLGRPGSTWADAYGVEEDHCR